MDVAGSTRDFSARAACPDPDLVWRRWTDPASWGAWDRGLRSAALDEPFAPGAIGIVVGLDGRRSRFVVDEVVAHRLVRWHVPLPGGRMELVRTLSDGWAEHRVQFHGPAARLWALLFGRRFRPLLAPTVRAVVASAPAAGGGPVQRTGR